MKVKSKKLPGFIIRGFFVLLFCLGFVQAQTENWVYRYNGPGNKNDAANSVVYGLDGNVYVAGYSNGTNSDFTVISLKPRGDTNWVYRYNGPSGNDDCANSIVYGSDGNIYAAGYSTGIGTGTDLTVISLKTTGAERWVYRYDGPGNASDWANSIVYNPDGYVYVAGCSNERSYNPDFIVISLKTTGAQNWVYRYNGPGNSKDEAKSVVYDPDGGYVYAAGNSWGSGTFLDFTVISLKTTGDTNWVYRYNGPANGYDEANSVVYGSDGNIYAAGNSYLGLSFPWGESYAFTVISLKTTGAQNWVYKYGGGAGGGTNGANSVVYGLDNNIYAAGYSKDSLTGLDFTVISLQTRGDTNWVYRYNGSGNKDDVANSVFYGTDTNIYAAGRSHCGSITLTDFTVISLKTTGAQNLVYQYNGSGNNWDNANSVIYGADSNIYAAGSSYGRDDDFTVISLSSVVGDTIPPTIPILISPLDSSFLNDASVTFVWHPSVDTGSGVKDYVLQYDLEPKFPNPTSTAVKDTFLIMILSDTSYYWRVEAVDSAGNESDWSEVWFFTLDTQKPDAPKLLSPINGIFLSDTVVNFEWTEATFMKGFSSTPLLSRQGSGLDLFAAPVSYVLQIDTVVNFGAPLVIDTLDVSTVTVALDEDFYYWRVKAFDLAGNESSYSGVDSFGVDITPPTIPILISPLDSSFLNDSSVTLLWHPSVDIGSGMKEYVLQYDLEPDFLNTLNTIVKDTFFTVILSDTSYYWRVKAVDITVNESDWSEVWSFTLDTYAPQTPVLLRPIGGIFLSDTVVNFEWTEVTFMKGFSSTPLLSRQGSGLDIFAAPVSYVLQIDTVVNFDSPLIIDTSDVSSVTVALDEDFYYWRVKAFDLSGNESPYSRKDSFGVDITPPLIESTTVWTDTSYMGPFPVYTKVTDVLTIDAVRLYFKRIDDPCWFFTDMMEGENWYYAEIPRSFLQQDTIKYYIYTRDVAQPANVSTDPSGAPTNYYWFTVGLTGIAEDNVIPKFFRFGLESNPIRGQAVFNLAIPEDGVINLWIYDVAGRLVDTPINGLMKAGVYDILWHTKTSAGVYFYRFRSSWQNKTGKLIFVR